MKESWKTLKLPLSPTIRKQSPQNYFSSTARSPSVTQGPRVSTPLPRPPGTPTGVRPSSASSPRPVINIQGISQENLRKLYLAKCSDLAIPENPSQESRFYRYCEKNLVHRRFFLKEQELGPICGKTLGEILQHSQSFYGVDVGNNHLLDSGIVKLGQCLSKNITIIHVNISSNELTPEGLRGFIDLFVPSSTLISLDISSYNGLNRNRIGPVAAEALCNLLASSPVLTFLELNDTGLSDPGLEWIIMGMNKNSLLLKLGISSNNITAKHMLEFSKVISTSNLQELNISGNKIGDDGCRGIADLLVGIDVPCRLKKLDISKNEITFKGSSGIFLAMRYNSVVTHMNMEENPLGAPAGQSLHFLLLNNFKMVWLNLGSCDLKSGGIGHLSLGLCKNKALVTLLLSNNGCKDLGINSLCEAIVENDTLVVLDLSYNMIQDGCSLAAALKDNIGLENLNLKENRIKEHAGPMLVEATKAKTNLLRLNLEANHIAIKHLEEIKANLKRNEELYYRSKAPNIKKEIEKLKNGHKDIDSIHEDIDRKKSEKLVIVSKIQKLKKKVEEIKQAPDLKLAELKAEYQHCREKSLILSTELDKLLLDITKIRITEEKSIRELEDSMAYIVAESKQLEKKSNL